MFDGIGKSFGKLLILWVASGYILSGLAISSAIIAQNMTAVATEGLMMEVGDTLPFPLDVLVSFQLNPAGMILQLLLFILLFFLFGKSDGRR